MQIFQNFKRSRKAIVGLGCGLIGAMSLASTASAGDGLYSVQLNKTEILRLPSEASAVVIGNPDIADVSIHSADTVLVVGKAYGETNLVILDRSGNTMMSSDIQVITPQSRNQVRIFNVSQGRQTYNCGPSCNPSPTLGDSNDFMEGNTAESGNPLTNLFAAAANASGSGDGASAAPSRPVDTTPN